jgi:hypothetical protein
MEHALDEISLASNKCALGARMPIRTTIVTNSASETGILFFNDPPAMYLDRFLDGAEICADLFIELARQ